MSFKAVDLQCMDCGYEEGRLVERDEVIEEIKCPNCDECSFQKVWRSAPSVRVGNDRSPHNIAKMQSSFRKRYMKTEINDVKHKFGEKTVNDALVSGEAKRIKEDLK